MGTPGLLTVSGPYACHSTDLARTEEGLVYRAVSKTTSVPAVCTLALMTAFGAASSLANAQGEVCRRDIRNLDDQAERDMREVNRLIALLDSEIVDPSLLPLGRAFQESLRVKLESAKLHRNEVLDKHHADLNAVRARCDRVRDAD